MTAKERWDCIFVDRIDTTGRIYLTTPQEYGYMFVSEDTKVKNSMPRECGTIKGSSNENKVLMATAIAIAFNHNKITSSNGLILRGFAGGMTAIFLRQDKTQGEKPAWVGQKRKTGTTGWLIYISPSLELYHVDEDSRSLGERLHIEQEEKICDCIRHILENLSWNPKFIDAPSKFDKKSLSCV